MLTAQHGGYFFWLVWALSVVLRLCFFRKVFKKSDTAFALRRSLSKVTCIIVVSINVYYEYFCQLMGLSAKSPHVLELLNITRQCKIRFLDLNIHFIEQIKHLLWNSDSWECILMKIFKSK